MTTTARRSPTRTAGWRTPIRRRPRRGSRRRTRSRSTTCATSPRATGSRSALTQLWDYEKYGVPFKEGGRYFYSKNTGLQNQSVLYTAPDLQTAPTELLDPNKLSADGTVSLSSYHISEDGHYMAYGLNASGSDWIEWRVSDVATGKDLSDDLKWSKFSGAAWTKDNKGFFYSRYDAPDEKTQLQAVNYYQKLYYHAIGTAQEKDLLVYDREDEKEWGFGGDVTEDGQYLIIDVSHGTDPKNRVFYRSLKDGLGGSAPMVELLARRRRALCLRRQRRPDVLFRHGPRRRARAAGGHRHAPARPKTPDLREVIPQAEETLQGVSTSAGVSWRDYLKDAHAQVKVFGTDGKLLARGGAARPRHGGRLRRQAGRRGNFLFVHDLHRAADDLSLRREDGRRRRSCSRRRWRSTRRSTRANRCSTRARTARACRWSFPTRRG